MDNNKDLVRNFGQTVLHMQDTIIRGLKTAKEFLFGQMEVNMMVCLLIIQWMVLESTPKQMEKWYIY